MTLDRDAGGVASSVAFGLILIGDELLVGTREDRHFRHFRECLSERGHALRWCWILPDEPDLLSEQLAHSMAGADPVFVCGGIGATPDDHTRCAAATAAGVPLTRHEGAAALIEGRFGAQAYPHRIRMADLPVGSDLIANPYNQIPGFVLRRHYFLPGFPEMAWPMAEAVLERDYPGRSPPLRERSVLVRGVTESRLIPMMEQLAAESPQLKLFSLPRLGPEPSVQIGFRGHDGIDLAFAALCELLTREGLPFDPGLD
ncbi:molybdopterin-binding protein [Thioalkalicoccus limnaeus]|uniref:Molybdopterin-binding protein n=1 Tax=Thioalkalicoccus limnaeus TaxID=120681 RepID=A0ABV4BD45_9GAMM